MPAPLGLLEPRHHCRVWHYGAAGAAREARLAGLQLRGKSCPVIGQLSQYNALSLVRRRRWSRPRAARSPANTTSTRWWGSRSQALRERWERQKSGFQTYITRRSILGSDGMMKSDCCSSWSHLKDLRLCALDKLAYDRPTKISISWAPVGDKNL